MNSQIQSIESPDARQVAADHRKYLFPCALPLYNDPIILAKGSGARVFDTAGREYLDLFSGILTTSVGHCHPDVVSRVREQVGRLGHTSTLYLNEPQVRFAKSLSEIAPGELSQSFFTNSGTEAVETAVMLACLYTGRSEIIALRHAYSGRSILATELTAHASWRPLASSFAGVKHVSPPYLYRFPIGGTEEAEFVEYLASELEDTIRTVTNGRPAAFMAETILGVGGYIVPPKEYFRRMVDIVHSYGGLFICDEVQAGFGRTGEKWFGIEHWGVEPDIMVMAKGIANGFPVGATITRPEIAEAWKTKTISTFGGNAVCMAAADATLEVMKREDTPSRSAERGGQLRRTLESLCQEHGWIGEVRGMGLMQALELVEDPVSKEPSPSRAKALLESAKDQGLLLGIGGLHGNVIRIGPSMLISEAEMSEALDRLTSAVRGVE
jgi:alanine-glyoxylate transaminase/(R)-3-amino-2-methylpropionate-pyruvate transaminase